MNNQNHSIAIMTWYRYQNYGTALQASAIYWQIKKLGYNPTLIQYTPKGNTYKEKTTILIFLKKICRRFFRYLLGSEVYQTKERDQLFDQYLKERITETLPCETSESLMNLNRKYSAFICGSDQIWSPICFDENYFLIFVEEKRRMIAYAPSFGVSQINDQNIRVVIQQMLQRFQHLSVRELQGARIIRELTGQKVKVVLDPTLLLTSDEWDKYTGIQSVPQIEGKYMLCYFLGNAARYRKFVKRCSKRWKISVYEIPIRRVRGRYPDFPFEVGPCEFVSLIRNAAFVFTDSFHGLAFSVNYGIPFVVFERFQKDDPINQNSRIYSFLELLGIQERLIDPASSTNIDKLQSFNNAKEIQDRLNVMRRESINYLQTSLKMATMTEDAEGHDVIEKTL